MRFDDALRDDTVLWAGLSGIIAIGLLAVLFPRTVFDRFVWRYFWGPVVADAHGHAAVTLNGVTATPGYTVINTAGYILLLLLGLLIIVRLLERMEVGEEKGFVLSLIPFLVGGGLLRVVEDAASAGMVELPIAVRYVLISPLIYVTMLSLVTAAIIAAVVLQRNRVITSYRTGLAAMGGGVAVFLALFLLLNAATLHLWVLAAVIGLATGVLGLYYLGVRHLSGSYQVSHLLDTELLAVVYAHLLDGSSTAVSIELVDFVSYGEKHPLPATLISFTGNAYSFILLKLAVAAAAVHFIWKDFDGDAPLLYNLLILTVLALGLGPATRNTVRAVLGI